MILSGTGSPLSRINAQNASQRPANVKNPTATLSRFAVNDLVNVQRNHVRNADNVPCVCKKITKVKLADGKERTIQHMMATSFWHPDGTPMSAKQFMEALFGKLPEFFKDEDELRSLWSKPDTRKKLLEGLAGARVRKRAAYRNAKNHR
jgi:hypothetical protein